jgi:hypothetical protein
MEVNKDYQLKIVYQDEVRKEYLIMGVILD